MEDVTKIELGKRSSHSAVCLDNFVIIIGGYYTLSTHVIWRYNLYTEEWKKHEIPDSEEAPDPFHCAVAVAIEGTIYTFGGRSGINEINALWTLSRSEREDFRWSFIETRKKKSPSPRLLHTGWEYAGKLWVFGGLGPSPEGYLNCHGDDAGSSSGLSANNQLLSYNPNIKKWVNPKCFGTVPSPRWGIVSAAVREKVFLFGGRCYNSFNEFFQLDMHSLTWTQLSFGYPSPHVHAHQWGSLTATSDNQLVLHGGQDVHGRRDTVISCTWIMDLASYSWRLRTSVRDHHRQAHTGTLGDLSDCVIIVGGTKQSGDDDVFNNIFYVNLEPWSLQELASRFIYKHKADLPCQCLPKKLRALLDISAD